MFNSIPFMWKLATENKLYILKRHYINSGKIELKWKGTINTKFKIAVISRENNNGIGEGYKQGLLFYLCFIPLKNKSETRQNLTNAGGWST